MMAYALESGVTRLLVIWEADEHASDVGKDCAAHG